MLARGRVGAMKSSLVFMTSLMWPSDHGKLLKLSFICVCAALTTPMWQRDNAELRYHHAGYPIFSNIATPMWQRDNAKLRKLYVHAYFAHLPCGNASMRSYCVSIKIYFQTSEIQSGNATMRSYEVIIRVCIYVSDTSGEATRLCEAMDFIMYMCVLHTFPVATRQCAAIVS